MLPNAIKRLFQAHRTKVVTTILTVFVLGFATFFAYTAYASGEKTLTLEKNGKKYSITTRANTVEELLKEQNIDIDEKHDWVNPSLDADVEDQMTVQWKEAHQVDLSVDGKSKRLWTTAMTVQQLLDQQGIKTDQYDTVKPESGSEIAGNMNVSIDRGIQVSLFDGKKKPTHIKAVAHTTVKQLLENQGITLGKNDKLLPKDRNQELNDDEVVKITRVDKETTTETEPIDYEIVKQNDSSLEKGQTRVIQNGEEGQVEKTYEITKATDHKGTTENRTLLKKRVTKNPKKKIIAVGTKVIQHQSQTSRSLSSSNDTVLYMQSTAFTASCKGCNGITSLGINLKAHPSSKVIAVDPSVIPLGSKVWVEGYGYAIAGDTGGGISGKKIDVFLPSKSQANRWGTRTVKVKILN
ncbi:uncharacterized protein YabE (DUF348 family) [Pullulanibacillus pueri]|uniref:G5 domain-containing protein n=1 Tax=Pullulanibacillus pueri TaxID=1437324 RepID=A0A8J3A0S8_9BACL|nr:G5 and 3D domain-containing protein [Pullulanibacillus pueri]MBM7683997.1 uncharacterized protein YabE (DUF348 family) [Pullulanibacillus pueri]GGH88340.1 hypothetical protein GCM10007096_40450 [Pullulanibacillus pueri]